MTIGLVSIAGLVSVDEISIVSEALLYTDAFMTLKSKWQLDIRKYGSAVDLARA
jgi:hypothetical protein